MAVELAEVRTRRELKEFIFLPEKVHARHAQWIPPIYSDEWRYFDARRNRSFTYSDTVLVLARRNGRAIGRVMGIINRRVIEKTGEKNARFGFLESFEDEAAVHGLLRYVEDWARARGMNKIVGPMGFTDQDPEGLLIEGYDEEPVISLYQNFPYLPKFVESAGYTKEIDYVDYMLEIPKEIPPLYARILKRMANRPETKLVEFTRTREVKHYIRPVLRLMNETFVDIYGYSPLDEQEMDNLAKQYLPLLDPRFIKVVERNREVVAFVVGIPNFNPGLRRSRGRLWPFGILHILRALKRSKQLDLLLGGVRQDCRGQGLDVLMGAAMKRSAIAAGMTRSDSNHELETNTSVRAEMERLGGKISKRFRIYQKAL
ncbi:MAG: hypothetical protein ABIK62_01330 [candidate division WOR-3 bacterium]